VAILSILSFGPLNLGILRSPQTALPRSAAGALRSAYDRSSAYHVPSCIRSTAGLAGFLTLIQPCIARSGRAGPGASRRCLRVQACMRARRSSRHRRRDARRTESRCCARAAFRASPCAVRVVPAECLAVLRSSRRQRGTRREAPVQ
jgi:hypothetical protein